MNNAHNSLDSVDRAILDLLQEDGRLANVDLADAVNLSPSACLRRVRRLEEEGFINQYVALINPSRVGMGTNVFVEITLSSQAEDALDAFEIAVTKRPEIMSCHLMAGDFDYLLRVVIDDVADYEALHRTHLAQLPGVARLVSSFALRPVCDRTAYPLKG
ncbi:MAG: Lrp/AsnC family transcriptional regulator [Actinomycetota bacterium]|jgi:Lrp/AsnC family leucine-responsive transcriptional regulator|nr:AsnC family transcriptional regulator [Acidimicrobiaceae bacterium]MEE2646636.1 Lrp/AsnC family transcriptional regulator [Actinomycetota bacterium]CAI8384726.1 MAG: Leucine-responsive regulatory protein [Acidimicrobiales bacterium AG-410-I20]|tara:strand:+ start:231 stop:710 length:480 start_codon:yes stop_codon:yes gene_type:complete